MKRILLSTAAALALTAAASAADLPARVAPPPMPVAVPVFSWTGFYVGVHGVWVHNWVDVSARTPFVGVRNRTFDLDDDGFGGGGQAGYNMQFGNIVAGLEADITATDIGGSRRLRGTVLGAPFTARFNSDMDYFGTVKGRVGFTFPSFFPFFQQSMVYVTGGLGYADTNNRVRVSVTRGGSASGRSEDTRFGFVVGGGTENAITSNLSIKTETLYYNLEDDNVALRGTGTRFRYENDGYLSRIGLNYRF